MPQVENWRLGLLGFTGWLELSQFSDPSCQGYLQKDLNLEQGAKIHVTNWFLFVFLFWCSANFSNYNVHQALP